MIPSDATQNIASGSVKYELTTGMPIAGNIGEKLRKKTARRQYNEGREHQNAGGNARDY